MHVLRKRPSISSVVESVSLISDETKGYICRYLKTMGMSINPTFYAWVIIERIAVKVAELRGVSP